MQCSMKTPILRVTFLVIFFYLNLSLMAQNVGVGTLTPQAKFHVLQDSNALLLQLDDTPNDSTPFIIDSTGNVGIGVVNPSQKLEVNGRIMDKSGYIMPVGSVLPYFGIVAPQGWLICNGAEISRTTYSDLYNVIGTSCGSGNGTSTFIIPDLRGMFLRGVDGTAGNDPDNSTRMAQNTGGNTGNNVGTVQNDTLASHSHTQNLILNTGGDLKTTTGSGSESQNAANTGNTGGSETRPVNVYVNYIIKF